MSSLSEQLVREFVKAMNDSKKESSPKNVNGTVVKVDGKTYVRLDGSDLLTPVSTTVDTKENDRVVVTVGNHTATIMGNTSDPSASSAKVEAQGGKISKFEVVMAYKVTTEDLEAANATIDSLVAKLANIDQAQITEADITELRALYAELDNVTADEMDVINASIENLQAKFGEFTGVSAEDLEALNAEITNLQAYNATFTYVDADVLHAMKAEINQLDVDKLTAEQADIKYAAIEALNAVEGDIQLLYANKLSAEQANLLYADIASLKAVQADIKTLAANKLSAKDAELLYANINFSNINQAAIEYLFTESGIIKDLVVSEGKITGQLVGVTILGDSIIAGTLTADKLVVLGEDGIYYKLNVDALGETTVGQMTEEEQAKLQNGLHGSTIIAKSVTAEKVAVEDLVAFGADIGGFHITENAIYSGAKESATNTTRGVYMDNTGQLAFGDSSNFIRYYKQDDGTFRLEVSASSILLRSGATTLEEELEDIRNNSADGIEIGGRNLIRNSTDLIFTDYEFGYNRTAVLGVGKLGIMKLGEE